MDNQAPDKNQPSEPKSWREERWERREERREARRAAGSGSSKAGALIAGLLLIVFGGLFLLQNFGNYTIPINNWGALFILIPAVAAFDRAYRLYRDAGNHFSAGARGAAFVGIILVIVTVVILLNLNWALWGPVLIILVGLAILSSVFFRDGEK